MSESDSNRSAPGTPAPRSEIPVENQDDVVRPGQTLDDTVEAFGRTLAQLRAENEELEREEAMRDLLQRNAVLRMRQRSAAGTLPLRTGSRAPSVVPSIPRAVSTTSSSPRTPMTDEVAAEIMRDAPAPLDHNMFRHVKTRDIKDYEGDTMEKCTSFIQDLDLRYLLLGMQSDRAKILFAGQYLRGQPKETFHSEVVPNIGAYTYDGFKQFLQNCVEDPVNRVITTHQAYEGASQKDKESVAAFAARLEQLERQMEPYTERQRALHLFIKLRKSLVDAIARNGEVPTNRAEVIQTATRIENAMGRDHRPRETAGSAQPAESSRRARGRDRERKRTSEEKDSEPRKKQTGANAATAATLVCYNCGTKGHTSRQCEKPKDPSLPYKPREAPGIRKVGAAATPAGKGSGSSKDPKASQ